MIKTSTLFILLLTIILSLISCEKGEHINEEKSLKQIVNVKSILGLSLPNSGEANANRVTHDNIMQFIIPDNIIAMTDYQSGIKTYSVALNLVQQDTLSNLVIVENGDVNYDYFLYEYVSSDITEWIADLEVGHHSEISPEIIITKLQNFSLRDGECFVTRTEYVCPSGQHRTGQGSECIYSSEEWSLAVTQMSVPCSGGGGGSGGGGSTTTTPNINAGTPCGGLKTRSEDTAHKAKLKELKLKAASQDFESAYLTYSNDPKFSGELVGDVNIEGGSMVELPASLRRLDFTGFMHCHLDKASKKNLAVFSLSDIVNFSPLVEYSTQTQNTLYLTSAKGNFALVVTNRIFFMKMVKAINETARCEEIFLKSYVRQTESATRQLEGLLLFFKNNKNEDIKKCGFEIFSADSEFNNWKKREISEGNTITETPC